MSRKSIALTNALVVSALIFAFSVTSRGQKASRAERGVTPSGSFSISDIENINLLNGNVNLNIPLASLPPIAGGKLSWTVSAQYNSKLWDITRYQENQDPMTWAPYHVNVPGTAGGWRIGNAYTIIFRNANDDFQRLWYPGNSGLPAWELNLINNNQWWKVVLRMPDGSEHELRPTDHSSYIGGQDSLRGFYNVIPSGNPMRYYSFDGTYLFARISSAIDWTVYMPDGTQIIQTPNGIQRIQDTNGNKIKIFSDGNGTHYQDEQTGREIRLTYNPSGQGQYQVWYRTVTGLEQHIDINLGTTTVQGKLYSITQPGCEFAGLTQALFSAVDVVREIVYPQTEPGQPQRRFTFSYNSDTTTSATDPAVYTCPGMEENYTRTVSYGFGELSRVVTPSGSIIDYSYTFDGIHSLSPYGIGDYLAQEKISEKKLTHDGTIDTWTYNIGDNFGTVTDPDGSTATEVAYCSLPNTPGCASNKSGLTYRSIRPFKKVERHWTNLIFSGGDNLAPNGVVTFNPVVDKEYMTLTDAQGDNLKMSAKVFAFDYNGNVIQETHYDWFDPALVSRDAVGVPTGVPASATVLRVINKSHYNQASSSSSANVYAKRSVSNGTPLILNAAKETILGSNIVQFSFDGQAYNAAPTAGNLTTQKTWVDLDSKWITLSKTYDAYGNVATSTDGRGKVTQFFYEDSTYALPTRVVVDPQNGTGAQTTTTIYDTSTGLVTSQTDANGQVTSIDYTNQLLGTIDPFGRPGIAKSPAVSIGGTNHQRRVTTTYLDSSRQVIVATDLNAENDKLLKTRTTNDMLGRPVLTEQTEVGTNYTISIKKAYLDMGRITLTSTPMRVTAASTDSWTRVTKDNAGRIVEVASFGGATQPVWNGTSGVYTGSVATAYEANFTTVTDQTGKVRRSMVDAVGRLRRVDEPDANGNLGTPASPVQSTNYSYDVLDNLTMVTQGPQSRTFTYDSLSRLRSAVNPESGTISYQYDDSGNLILKTDARGVSAHFEYDSINRITRRWYNGSSSVSATTHNTPALPAGVGATDEAKFYYDSQSLPGSAPSYARGSAVGRLVAQTYGGGSNGDYFAYDVLGRTTTKYQQMGTVNFQISGTYNLSGALISMTYPSGHTINNSYDQAGRLTTFGGNLGDGTNRTYSSGILYSPTGALVKEQFGTATAIFNKLFYNSRGQLAEIRTSTSYTGPTDTTWDRGAIINNYSNQCSGLCAGSSMSDNNGNLKRQENHIPSQTMRWQEYDYDSLNRLNWVREVLNGGAEQWKQQFNYDRWGNRTINTGATYGIGINNKAFTVNTTNNRLGVPGGQPGVMTYDNAGNLTTDTYTGVGHRTYDAENRITAAADNTGQTSRYTYDGDGKRVRRQIASSQEQWQVYGIGGELLAEYRASLPVSAPEKEYGYRNGQLLVTAAGRLNVALGANGGVATASSAHTCCGFSTTGAINGNYRGPWSNGEGWNDATENVVPDWIQVDFAGSKTIDEISVFSLHDNFTQENAPTETQTFSLYGLLAFNVQYWNGGSWVTIPGGSVTGNNKVWRKFTFSPITTSKIRVFINSVPDAWSRVVEIQAFGTAAGNEKIQWVVSDQLGTPRMIFDQSGTLENMKRHDYLPFGEEIFPPTGGRSPAMGYSGGDGVRPQFASKERDHEIGLDYFGARYYSSTTGRFTGSDPGPFTPADPQNLNRYSYVQNNPLKFIDPTGRSLYITGVDADYIAAELAKFTGLSLQRDANSGKVTIKQSAKRNTKGTSTRFANKLRQAIRDPRAEVKIETGNNHPGALFDSYEGQKLDVDDYKAFKAADEKFAAASLAHVVEEYYYEQLLKFAGSDDPGERPAGDSRGPLTRTGRFSESHAAAEDFESKVMSDFTGWWEQPVRQLGPQPIPNSNLYVVRFEYSTVAYDVVVKNGSVAAITKHEKKMPK